MSSTKWTITLIVAIIVAVIYSYVEPKLSEPGDPKTLTSDHNPKFNLHPEIDKTDTYAIQLDSSEEDQNVELEQLEHGYQKNSSKKK